MANADPALEEVPNLNYDQDLTEEIYYEDDGGRLEEEYYNEEGYYDDYDHDGSDGAGAHIVGDYTQLLLFSGATSSLGLSPSSLGLSPSSLGLSSRTDF